MLQVRRAIWLMLMLVGSSAVASGCSSGGTGSPPGTQAAPTGQASTPVGPSISGQLTWSHMDKGATGDQEARYVVKVTNSGGSPASLHLEAKAVDATGTDVGDESHALPAVPGHSQAYFYSCMGCTAFGTLTGTPVKVSVAFTQDDVSAGPMLQTSEVTLKSGDTTYADLPNAYAYDMTAKVTNTTGEKITGGVQQDGVLFNQAGRVVGGFGIDSSDDVPDTLAPGESYRENASTIEAVEAATRVEYTVWSY